ncbi:MAG TPA: hypothetical protein PK547_02035 [Candidatus Paceibacterota bacterium]|nr:hypothetical protein [Candidatus Paceibacterota bacterium]
MVLCIAVGGIVIIAVLGLLFSRQQFHNIAGSDNRFVAACEKSLIKDVSDYKICKITEGKLIPLNNDQLSTKVHPRDHIVISINLKKLIVASGLVNPLMRADSKAIPDQNLVLCYTLYPVLMGNFLENNSQGGYVFTEQKISSLYDQYIQEFKWTDFLKGTGLKTSRNVNLICAQNIEIERTPIVSFGMKLPSADLLDATEKNGIVNPDLRKYGVKILLANNELISGGYSREEILANYDKLLPLAIFTNDITY